MHELQYGWLLIVTYHTLPFLTVDVRDFEGYALLREDAQLKTDVQVQRVYFHFNTDEGQVRSLAWMGGVESGHERENGQDSTDVLSDRVPLKGSREWYACRLIQARCVI